MKFTNIFFGIVLLLGAVSCNTSKKASAPQPIVDVTGLNPKKEVERPLYKESRKRVHDLLHTRLEVKFDFEKAHLLGTANLTLKPYFYSTNTLELDAKGFDITRVALSNSKTYTDLKYNYNGKIITINLDRTYHRTDTFSIYIEYTAKPNELEEGGSAAITSDKGLYFINNDGKDPHKPIQIWTQGETEASSAWFPTIDSPNERMSQEIYITVDEKYVTLSNGLLMFSLENGDGTRTDYWKQELPHAPYLAMMAIGEYAIVKDKWRNLDVNYYVEKPYEPYAKAIFGNTPEMMEFYSNVLGVDYPWDKYHQVVVRDYVSGAMENTGAVIFGEFMNKTHRELLDGDNESIVAHELFHHWFGDLVTCESWANLPLNESFATYGEYLWFEHKYGRDMADHHIQGNMNQYLMESRQKQVDMIRFNYVDKEDMFDGHSYSKGGRILHMLRKYVGDNAFFESLQLYLNTHKFSSVEIHDLRLAFEKVTGEDLNWFFNQWFLSSGHADIEIKTSYDEKSKKVNVSIEQKQDFDKTPLYKLPLDIDIYVQNSKQRHRIVADKVYQEFTFDLASKPDLVNVDAEKMLLAVKKERKDDAEWAFMYNNAPLYLDRYEAIENLMKSSGEKALSTVKKALDDPYQGIRSLALKSSSKLIKENEPAMKEKLMAMAVKDEKSSVRAAAIKQLSLNFKGNDATMQLYRNSVNDSSYTVITEALNAIVAVNEKEAVGIAKSLEKEKNSSVIFAIASIYAKAGTDEENEFFIRSYPQVTGFNRYAYIGTYNKYLKGNRSEKTIIESMQVLEDVATNEAAWWMRMVGIQAISDIYSKYSNKEFELREEIKKANAEGADPAEMKASADAALNIKNITFASLKKIKENETDKNLIKFLGAY
jgi:aminopeptidase N